MLSALKLREFVVALIKTRWCLNRYATLRLQVIASRRSTTKPIWNLLPCNWQNKQ